MRLSRRALLGRLAFGFVGGSTPPHTLVSVFLRGGADTLSFFVPHEDDGYHRLRPTLSVDTDLALDGFYRLHPGLEPLLPIFREGRLGVVQGVGSDNPTGSHFESQDQMEKGEAFGRRLGGGWLARHLRSRPGFAFTPLSAVALGKVVPESLRGAPAVSAFESLGELSLAVPSGGDVARALGDLWAADSTVLGERGRETLDLLGRVEALRGETYRPDGGAEYPDDDFGAGLREIARLIKAGVGLEAAAIDLDGWDTHFVQGTTDGLIAGLIGRLGRGLAAFDADLAPVRDRVTTVVLTEFGRRTYENASLGTDHGRGFAAFAIGPRIAGGRIHGDWPGVDPDQEEGPGGLPIRIDYRSVLAEILAGCTQGTDLDAVFPGFAPMPVGLVR